MLAQAVDEFWSRADTQAMAELAGRVDLVEAISPRDRLSIALATKRAKYSGQFRADTESTQLIVAAASEIDDDRLVAIAHTQGAINAVLHDRRDDALHHAEIAVAAARRADSSSGARLAYALLALGLALDAQQHHDEAFAAFEEAVAVTDVGEIWSATEALAGHHIKRSQIAEAARLYGAVLDHHRSLGHLGRASDLCAQVAELLVTLERDREAIEVYSVLASQKPPLFDVDSPFFAANLDRARQRLPNDEFEAAAAAGAAITLDDLVDTLIDRLAELAGSEPYG